MKSGGDFSATGARTICPGSTTNAPSRTVLASRVIPSGSKALLKYFSAKVIDTGNSDQIFFAIERNGSAIQSGLNRIPGMEFDFQSQIELNLLLLPGTIEIVAYNISGVPTTIESDALVAVDVKCQAYWVGELVSERGGVDNG